jgi:hypothetical protein
MEAIYRGVRHTAKDVSIVLTKKVYLSYIPYPQSDTTNPWNPNSPFRRPLRALEFWQPYDPLSWL